MTTRLEGLCDGQRLRHPEGRPRVDVRPYAAKFDWSWTSSGNCSQKVSLDEVRQGEWLARLLKFSLDQYVEEVDAAYFSRLYPGLSPDDMVRARIELAARYASIGGALTAGAYAGALAATVGSRGAASPVMLPAAGASFVLDLLFLSNLQLRLAYDIAIISGVPLDLEDPEDLWRLIRLAFVLQGRATRWEALGRKAPPWRCRPSLLKIFTSDPAAAERSLPAMGDYCCSGTSPSSPSRE